MEDAVSKREREARIYMMWCTMSVLTTTMTINEPVSSCHNPASFVPMNDDVMEAVVLLLIVRPSPKK